MNKNDLWIEKQAKISLNGVEKGISRTDPVDALPALRPLPPERKPC
jgi:hypothetical protein